MNDDRLQLDLFGTPVAPQADSRGERPAGRPSSHEPRDDSAGEKGALIVASERPPTSSLSARGEFGYELPCARCNTPFWFSWSYGKVACPTCAGKRPADDLQGASDNAPWDDRCIVIGCVAIAERPCEGSQVCQKHDTEQTAKSLREGRYPGLYEFEGRDIILPTQRLLSEGPSVQGCRPGGLFIGKPTESDRK